MYLLLADLVVLFHFLFIIVVVLGGLLVIKWRKFLWFHLPCLFWGILIEFSGWICPLTPLEIWLRQQAGVDIYQGGFISHYLAPVIYPSGLTPGIQMILGTVLILLNLAIYSFIFLSQKKSN